MGIFLVFFGGGLLPKDSIGKQKSNFWNFIYIFYPFCLAFQLCCSPMLFRICDFLLLKNCHRKFTIFQGAKGT